MWDINQGQERRHTLSRASRPFPWFPVTIALEGSGLGGDLFQKEKDAALTPLVQNPSWGSHWQAGSIALRCPASLYSPIVTQVTPRSLRCKVLWRGRWQPLRTGMALARPAQPKPPAVPEGSSAPCPLPWQGDPRPWGSGMGTEDMVPTASRKAEMGSAWVIRKEEITPSLSVPDSFQHHDPSPLSSRAFPASHLLPMDLSP